MLMYKVSISHSALATIDDFIESYLNSFLKLFIDSWIDNVDEIEKNYQKTAKLFRDKIFFEIESIFKEDVIWKKTLPNWFSSSIFVWNYRFFIDFYEDNLVKERFINSIKINKK